MAHSALDEGSNGRPSRLYFAGWEPLALVLGREIPRPEPDTEEASRARRLASETVRRAIRDLVDAGLVEPLAVAYRGNRQTYRLNL
jgi:hypothetical protein